MTTTIVFGQASDGYLYSTASTNAAAASGTAITLTAGSTGAYSGQWTRSPEGYRHHQAFFGFAYSAVPATELVTSANVRLSMTTVNGPSIARRLEIRGFAYGTLATADWRTSAQLVSCPLQAEIVSVNTAGGKTVFGGSGGLADTIASVTSFEFVAVTDRQRAAIAPTADESEVFYLSEGAGTTYDPQLVFTSVTRSTLVPVLGCQARLSDGTWVVLKSNGAALPTVTLNWVQANGTETLVSTLSLTQGGTNTFYYGNGAQNFSLTVDSADNVYVMGPLATDINSIGVKSWAKNVSAGSWTAKNFYSISMPAYSQGWINNIAAAWHDVAGGTLVAFCAHNTGSGAAGGTGAEVSYVLVSSQYLLTNGSGTLVRGSGNALGGVMPAQTNSNFNSFGNETGTGLDCVPALGTTNPGWGYLGSFQKNVVLGGNGPVSLGRYILNTTGTGFTHASAADDCSSGTKDGNAKVRAAAIDSITTAVASAGADAGVGISIAIQRHSGTTTGSVNLGYCELSGESIASMPSASAVCAQNWWDVVYNSADNQVWVYYVSAADPRVLMRTAFNLNTYNPVRNEVTVATIGAAGSVIQAIRVERFTAITTNCLVTVAYKTSGGVLSTTYTVDAYSLAPLAPTLAIRSNFDATAAATLSWTFADQNTGDTQASYQVQIVDSSTGTTTVDTGQVTSSTASRTLTANTLTNNKSYQWRVRTWDTTGLVGPYSSYGTFQTGAGGSVTITDPAVDDQAGIVSNDYRVTWTATGTTQASYRVKVVRTSNSAVLSDSGYIAGTQTFYQLPGGMLSDVEYQIQVTVKNASNVESPMGTRLITPSYAYPPQPAVNATPVEDGGYVLVSAENPVPGATELGVTPYYFETDVAGFTMTSATIAQSTAQAHEGTHSALVTTTGTPTSATMRVQSSSAVAVNVGSRYTARCWVYSTAGYSDVAITIDWLNSSKTLISSSTLSAAVPAATWTEKLLTAVAPANAAYAVYGPTIGTSPPTGTAVYVDELVLLLANDVPDADYNQVLRRVTGSSDPYTVLGTFEPGDSFRDYTAAGGVSYEYRVVAVGQ